MQSAAYRDSLKRLIRITKETDLFYLDKRGLSHEYDPNANYNFEEWRHLLTPQVRSTYESLHKNLLYTDEPQDFKDALTAFSEINAILAEIGE